MDTDIRRFPSLTRRKSVSTITDQSSSNDQLTNYSTSTSLSRFPSLCGTKNSRATTPASISFNHRHDGDSGLNSGNLAVVTDVRSQYGRSIYATVDLPPGDFLRLLRVEPGTPGSPLECVLFVATIAECRGRFTALSYVWGQDGILAPVFINGRRQSIRRNLYAFLCALRSLHGRMIVWVDAICIDQENNKEKTHQVMLMRKIYSAAACTRAWLGDDLPALEQIMTEFRKVAQDVSQSDIDTTHKFGAHILLQLIEHEYWSRTWIIQEILLAKEIFIHCGKQSLCWADLLLLARKAANQPNASRLLHLRALGECTMMHLHKMRRSTQSRGLPELLRDYGTTLCEDIRDRIYGLVGLIDDHNDPLYINDAIETSNRARDLIDYSSSSKELFFQLLQLYHSLPVHRFALPLWTALRLDYAYFDTAEFCQTLYVQGFPCSRLIMTRAHVWTLHQAAANMNLDNTTGEELLSFSSPGDLAEARYSRVCLSIRVKINDFHLSESYQACACSIEPRGLVLERHGYDLLCQAFDGARVHRQAPDQRANSIWVMEITVAGLKTLNVVTKPADNQYFLDSIQAENFNEDAVDADISGWIAAVRRPINTPKPNPRYRMDKHRMDLNAPPPHTGYFLAKDSMQQQHREPAVVTRKKKRHKIVKGSHLTGVYNWLTKPIYGEAEIQYN